MAEKPSNSKSNNVKNFVEKSARTVTENAKKAGTTAKNGAKTAASTVKNASSAVLENAKDTINTQITPEQVQELLGTCYDKALNGVPGISQPLEEYVASYTDRYSTPEKAAQELIKNQLIKCTTSGALSGAAGFFVLPISIASIPANIANVLYVQLRMIAGVAMIGGYEVRTDQVQTLIYACLAGSSATDMLKEAGITTGQKLAMNAIKKIPGTTLTAINRKVGFRFITRFGETGIINLGKMVPVVGAVIGGLFDFTTTKVIASTAYNYFINPEETDIVNDKNLSAEADKKFEHQAAEEIEKIED
ncbi:uncharacterized protein BN613_00480 [Cryptobacterium sp. CAG:338]|nr:uncharacterized protein BN613_00480 [Cryptobacterium sp. CAG:338]